MYPSKMKILFKKFIVEKKHTHIFPFFYCCYLLVRNPAIDISSAERVERILRL